MCADTEPILMLICASQDSETKSIVPLSQDFVICACYLRVQHKYLYEYLLFGNEGTFFFYFHLHIKQAKIVI